MAPINRDETRFRPVGCERTQAAVPARIVGKFGGVSMDYLRILLDAWL